MDKDQKKWMFILIILILILLNVAMLINEINLINSEDKNKISNEVTTGENNEVKTDLEKHIEEQEENIRVQYYVAKFLELIEDKDYQKAYDLLNEDFKKNNFDTIEKFQEFCKIYPEKDGICKYDDFDRIGSSLYVITVTINQLDTETYKPIKQNFVIRENNYNDFRVSLQMDYSYVKDEVSEGNVVK